MQFALSTLGCPELAVREAAQLARSAGYRGLELRSAPDGTISRHASPEQRRSWLEELRSASVRAVSVASYLRLCDDQLDDGAFLAAALAELRLAADLDAPWLRVFAGGAKDVPCPPEVEAKAAERLGHLATAARPLGITVAVETHDSHPTARDVTRLIDTAGVSGVAVIWDVLHTWLKGEPPETTAQLLNGRLAYVQVKDVPSREDLTPVGLGDGVLPLQRCLDLVRAHHPAGWVSWEYERRWHPTVPALTQVAAPALRWLEAATT
jgi:sugar phosphate isomerase/epimerase